MKGPGDFDKLSDEDLTKVEEIVADVEKWFEEGRETYHINWFLDKSAPERVWKEVVKRADAAGWDASMSGAIVEIRKP